MFCLNDVDGLRVTHDNKTVLSGAVLELAHRLDRLFDYWAVQFGAEEHRYSPLVSVEQLHKLEYFKSFPHQAIFPVSLSPEDGNLSAFSDDPISSEGELQLTKTSPIDQCLAPAACFPIYMSMAGQELPATSFVTLQSQCFRKEDSVTPLARQTTFTMREIVCVGVQDEVLAFLDRFKEIVEDFFEHWSLPVALERATDPFFNAPRNPKYIMQKIAPLKHEMVFDGHLAIGSINFHQNSFGETFDISCRGDHVFSGCVAFGIERWLFAFLDHFGTDPESWPSYESLVAGR
jgi:seryl-tRNA synthetase